jgi:IMP dehydrogenase/GMP reductase
MIRLGTRSSDICNFLNKEALVNKTLSYDDVLLVPQYSDIKSRTEVSLETNLGND